MPNPEWKRHILGLMAGSLKPLGFKRRAGLFSRPRDGVVHLIGLQSSTGSTAASLKLTVNVAIWIDALAPVRGGKPDRPNVWSAPWRQRIGDLMPDHDDVWWTVSSDQEADEVGRAVTSAIRGHVLPALEEHGDSAEIVRQWRHGTCIGITDHQRQKYLKQLIGRAG